MDEFGSYSIWRISYKDIAVMELPSQEIYEHHSDLTGFREE